MPEMNRRVTFRLLPMVLGLLAVAFISIRGCQEGPFGRKQVVLLNPQQEAQLGAQAYREVLSKAEVVGNGPLVDMVQEVTRRLAKATEHPEFLRLTKLKPRKFDWEVRVVQAREVNAFCLPGGKMVVYTGILPVCETDAGLAVVMGHEISHALASHGAERMAQQQMAQIGVTAAGHSLGDLSYNERASLMRVLNAGATYGILKYSREHESEADRMGLLLMATAGYDPREAALFWERMAKLSTGGGPPEFMSTHPSHERRIRDLQGWVPEALPLFQAYGSPQRPRPLPRDRSFSGGSRGH